MKQWLEMEIGITVRQCHDALAPKGNKTNTCKQGGEEDGVDNSEVDNASLYTQPEDIWQIEEAFRPISPYFSIAAGFG